MAQFSVNSMHKRIQELEYQNQDFKAQQTAKNEETQKLRDELKFNMDKLELEIRFGKQENLSLKETIKNLTMQVDKLTYEARCKELEIRKYKDQENDIKRLSSKSTQDKKEIVQLKSRIDAQNSQLVKQIEEITKAFTLKTEMEAKMKRLEKEIELRKLLAQKAYDIGKVDKNKIQKLKEESDNKYCALVKENAANIKRLKELNIKMAKLETENAANVKKIKVFTIEMDQIQKSYLEYEEWEKEFDKKKESYVLTPENDGCQSPIYEMEDYDSEMSKLEANIAKLKNKNKELEAKLKAKEEKLKTESKNVQDILSEYTNLNTKFISNEAELKSQQNRITKLVKDNDSYKSTVSKLEIDISKLNAHVKVLQYTASRKNGKLRANEIRSEEFKKLETKLKAREIRSEEFKKLETKLKANETVICSNIQELGHLKSKVTELTGQVKHYKKKVDDISSIVNTPRLTSIKPSVLLAQIESKLKEELIVDIDEDDDKGKAESTTLSDKTVTSSGRGVKRLRNAVDVDGLIRIRFE